MHATMLFTRGLTDHHIFWMIILESRLSQWLWNAAISMLVKQWLHGRYDFKENSPELVEDIACFWSAACDWTSTFQHLKNLFATGRHLSWVKKCCKPAVQIWSTIGMPQYEHQNQVCTFCQSWCEGITGEHQTCNNLCPNQSLEYGGAICHDLASDPMKRKIQESYFIPVFGSEPWIWGWIKMSE